MTRPHQRGQLLLISLLLLAFLAASIPLMLSIVSRLSKRFVDRASDERVSDVARAAFTQVGYVLESQPEIWERAMASDPLKDVGFDGSRRFEGPQKTPYSVLCEQDSILFPAQLKVTVNVWVRDKSTEKARLFQALLSHRTMGADLPDMAHAPAALYLTGDANLGLPVSDPPQLDVQWGSIVCLGTLTLGNESNATLGHHPRKYCRIGYLPSYPVKPKTDHQEYWVGFPMGPPVEVDDEKYQQVAKNQSLAEGPPIGLGASGGYAELPDKTIALGVVTPAQDGQPTSIFYLDASVQFQTPGVDLKEGAMIVTHNAIFEDHPDGIAMQLHVPPHADRDYPFLEADANFPCKSKMGGTCSSSEALGGDGLVDFRGFLYVKGDLYINQDTVIAGVVRVDGTLRIASGKHLTILLDDRVARSIFLKGSPIEQQVISQPVLPH